MVVQRAGDDQRVGLGTLGTGVAGHHERGLGERLGLGVAPGVTVDRRQGMDGDRLGVPVVEPAVQLQGLG